MVRVGQGWDIHRLVSGRPLVLAGIALPFVKQGSLRALAVTTPKRVAVLPDLPAMAELLPGFDVMGWYGVLGPARLPKDIVAKLHDELVRILTMPEVRERILADGSEPVGSTPEAFRKYLLADAAKWAKLIKPE